MTLCGWKWPRWQPVACWSNEACRGKAQRWLCNSLLKRPWNSTSASIWLKWVPARFNWTATWQTQGRTLQRKAGDRRSCSSCWGKRPTVPLWRPFNGYHLRHSRAVHSLYKTTYCYEGLFVFITRIGWQVMKLNLNKTIWRNGHHLYSLWKAHGGTERF